MDGVIWACAALMLRAGPRQSEVYFMMKRTCWQWTF